ncbi:MAG: outer membrane protein transport protein [Luteolibacter sp.]|uniref:OmpP1/FadL family transporter n=1 Tax=Luteolibacter sp. TaxID=1962973 RepID=UPI003264D7E0
MTFLKKTLIVLLTGTPSVLMANGFRLVSQDAFAAARGEAFVATADNASAVHYNPAGLTQLEGDNVRSGIYALHFEPTYQAPAGSVNAGKEYEIENPNAFAPQLYYAYGLENSPVTLGLGVYAPNGASVAWPQGTGFRAVAIEGDLTYLRVNPVVAVEILPGLSLAGGVMIDYGDIALEQGLLRTESPFANSFRFEGDDYAVGYNLGLLWKINEQWAFGATYRSAVTMGFKGETQIEQQPVISPTTVPAEVEFEFPYTAVFGVSYRPTKKWNIEANADYSNWSCMDTVTIRQAQVPPFPVQQDIPVNLDFEDSWIYKFGVTRYFDNGWYGSAGYLYNENSVSSKYYSPTVADLDRQFVTLGIGREWGRYKMDAAFQLGFAEDRKISGSTPGSTPGKFVGQTADGTYGFSSHALLLSLSVKF